MVNGTVWDGELCAQVLMASLEEFTGKNPNNMKLSIDIICAAARTVLSSHIWYSQF